MDALPQLLGGLPLGNVVNGVLQTILDPAGFSTPSITAQLDPSSGVITITYVLETALTAYPQGSPTFDPDSGGKLHLNATFTANPTGTQPTYSVNGSIDPFTVYLVDEAGEDAFISLHFESFGFAASSGNSPTVDVNLDSVSFLGDLQFVNELARLVESLGGSRLAVTVAGHRRQGVDLGHGAEHLLRGLQPFRSQLLGGNNPAADQRRGGRLDRLRQRRQPLHAHRGDVRGREGS